MQTAICMKWGTRYGPDYVNRLHSALMRNVKRPTKLVCYTDDANGLDPAVEAQPLLDVDMPEPYRSRGWKKLTVWRKDYPGVSGDVLFLDLDIVITGPMDDFWDYKPGELCIIENYTSRGSGVGNSSVFRFPVGANANIWERFAADPMAIVGAYDNEQIYLSREAKKIEFWPRLWCRSFKHELVPAWPMRLFQPAPLPLETKIVIFTGKPDPDEARDGKWPAAWHKRFYRTLKPTGWIREHWR